MALNRREFLKTLIAGVAGLTIPPNVDQLLNSTAQLSDADFVAYFTFSMNLYIHNPSHCVIITNIAEPE